MRCGFVQNIAPEPVPASILSRTFCGILSKKENSRYATKIRAFSYLSRSSTFFFLGNERKVGSNLKRTINF